MCWRPLGLPFKSSSELAVSLLSSGMCVQEWAIWLQLTHVLSANPCCCPPVCSHRTAGAGIHLLPAWLLSHAHRIPGLEGRGRIQPVRHTRHVAAAARTRYVLGHMLAGISSSTAGHLRVSPSQPLTMLALRAVAVLQVFHSGVPCFLLPAGTSAVALRGAAMQQLTRGDTRQRCVAALVAASLVFVGDGSAAAAVVAGLAAPFLDVAACRTLYSVWFFACTVLLSCVAAAPVCCKTCTCLFG